jgi:hypothetical protein
MPEESSNEYITTNLPAKLMLEIDQIIKSGAYGYKSRSEFIKEAVRKHLRDLKATQPSPPLPTLEHFNLNETGVRILDRTLFTKTSSGRIIDVSFKPGNVYCEYCESNKCQHVKFALELEPVQEILNKKGWTIKA